MCSKDTFTDIGYSLGGFYKNAFVHSSNRAEGNEAEKKDFIKAMGKVNIIPLIVACEKLILPSLNSKRQNANYSSGDIKEKLIDLKKREQDPDLDKDNTPKY